MIKAANTLAIHMANLSEEAWCAGWMDGLEYALWQAVVQGPYRYGMLVLTPEHVTELRSLSAACGGWIIWGQRGTEFIPASEWHQLYAQHLQSPST